MIWNIVLFYYSPGNKPAGIPDTKKDILKTPVANGRSRLHWLCCSSTWDKPKKAAFSFRGFKAPMAIIPIRTYIILSHLKIFFAGNDMLQVPSCLCLGVFLTGEGATFYFWLKLVICFRWSSKRNWPLHLCTMHWRLCLVLLVIPIFPSPCQFVIPTNHNQECNFARSLYSWGCFVWSGGRNLKNRVVHDVWSFF